VAARRAIEREWATEVIDRRGSRDRSRGRARAEAVDEASAVVDESELGAERHED